MAQRKLETSGKWATNGNWSGGVKPEAGDDVLIPAGKEVKIEAAAKCRSLYGEGNCKIAGSSGLEIGNSEKPEGPAGNSWALKIDSECVLTANGNWTLLSTAAETQKVAVGPAAAFAQFVVKAKSTAKYRLEAALTFTGSEGIKLNEETTLDTNGFTVSAKQLRWGGAKVTLTLGTSTIECTGNLFEAPGTESTVSAASSTIIMSGAAASFAGGGWTWGTVTFSGAKPAVSGSGTTIATLNVNNKGVGAGEGVQLTKGMTLKATTVATNGTEASPARLESTEAGKVALLELGEQELSSWLKLKDIEVPAGKGPWYLPKGTDEGGNKTVGTTIKFEAKSGGTFTFAATAVIGSKPTASGKMIAASAMTAGIGSRAAAEDQRALAFSGASTATLKASMTNRTLSAFSGATGVSIMPKGTFVRSSTGSRRSIIFVFDE
jgi:hypothetical protein